MAHLALFLPSSACSRPCAAEDRTVHAGSLHVFGMPVDVMLVIGFILGA